ncbi:hypothetical protein [Aliiruegeria sabulilitoris]|uniref:hypothetical protein n=1 Tax=Aliiruegeria sabulilitoris TaxID=1510458 RepID=UPI00082F4064|nr:hypothetical protein [Aliiruegeria sabulilitoris]NDR57295.1 hypothetical protein [Pseudoruegeria sp. M32A2M]
MTRYFLVGLAFFALASCQSDEAQRKIDDAEAAECAAQGGNWGVAGAFNPNPICTLPTPDAGKVCNAETDCTGMCMADSRTCSTHSPIFGCHVFLDDEGREFEMCID